MLAEVTAPGGGGAMRLCPVRQVRAAAVVGIVLAVAGLLNALALTAVRRHYAWSYPPPPAASASRSPASRHQDRQPSRQWHLQARAAEPRSLPERAVARRARCRLPAGAGVVTVGARGGAARSFDIAVLRAAGPSRRPLRAQPACARFCLSTPAEWFLGRTQVHPPGNDVVSDRLRGDGAWEAELVALLQVRVPGQHQQAPLMRCGRTSRTLSAAVAPSAHRVLAPRAQATLSTSSSQHFVDVGANLGIHRQRSPACSLKPTRRQLHHQVPA